VGLSDGLPVHSKVYTNTLIPVNIQIPNLIISIRSITYEVLHAWTVGGRNWSQSLLRVRAPDPEVEGV
jgi:hypothetical protein